MVETTKGNSSAHQLITHAESLLLALDAVTRELDETLPRALDRMDAHGKTTRSALAQMKPMLEASEMVAKSTLSQDRKSVVEGKSVSVRVDLGGGRSIIKKMSIVLNAYCHHIQQ